MSPEDKEKLATAVNELIESSDAKEMHKKFLWVHEVASKGIPVRLTGRLAVLNPLLDLMLDDVDAAQRVLDLVERKRSDAGLAPLGDSGFDRKKYMREMMSNKRARQRRLVDLWNQLRPERDAVRGVARMEFERSHAARWQAVIQERENALRDRKGSRLSVEERTSIIRNTWNDVDAELDALEEYVQTELRKPATARGAGFVFRLQPKGTT